MIKIWWIVLCHDTTFNVDLTLNMNLIALLLLSRKLKKKYSQHCPVKTSQLVEAKEQVSNALQLAPTEVTFLPVT